jgi:lipoprotein NlpI
MDESARELNQAISLNPKYTDARVQLGLVLSQENDFKVAANVFRELIRPSFAEAHNNLGLFSCRRRKSEAHYNFVWH